MDLEFLKDLWEYYIIKWLNYNKKNSLEVVFIIGNSFSSYTRWFGVEITCTNEERDSIRDYFYYQTEFAISQLYLEPLRIKIERIIHIKYAEPPKWVIMNFGNRLHIEFPSNYSSKQQKDLETKIMELLETEF